MTAQDIIRQYVFSNESLWGLLRYCALGTIDAEAAAEHFQVLLAKKLAATSLGAYLIIDLEKRNTSLKEVDYVALIDEFRDEWEKSLDD